MKRTHIDVNFTPDKETQALYNRIVKARTTSIGMTEHAINLMRKGLDCTCAPKPKSPKGVKKK